MAKRSVDDDSLAALADAIRAKGGISDPLVFPEGFVNAVEAIQGGANEDLLAARVTGTLTEYSNNDITKISSYAFAGSGLVNIDMPNVTIIGQYAFYSCKALTEINFPLVKSIYQYAFQNCSLLEAVHLPVFTGVPTGDSTTNANYIFQGCAALKTVTLPEVIRTGSFGFFRDCTNLEEVRTPKIQSIGQYHVYNCKSLRLLDNGFAKLTSYGCLTNTSSLKTLILRSTTVAATNLWSGSTLDTAYTGDIVCDVYVPDAIIDDYKVATNWSALYEAGRCNFVAIEGSEYE